MVQWVTPLQIRGTNNYRLVLTSDEGGADLPLCECEGGHANPYEAKKCEHAQDKLKQLFFSGGPIMSGYNGGGLLAFGCAVLAVVFVLGAVTGALLVHYVF